MDNYFMLKYLTPLNNIDTVLPGDTLTERIKYLEKIVSAMKSFLKEAPEGNLICRKNENGIFRYYRNFNGKQTYIPMTEIKTAKALAEKKIVNAAIKAACEEVESLKKASLDYGKCEREVNTFILDNPGCACLIRKDRTDNEIRQKILNWQQETYIKNPHYQENLIFNTMKGEKVRSKSEAFIADVLYMSQIPYRYECELRIGNVVYYPDFMIMDPLTGQIYIWEHFGLIEMEKYLHNTANKIRAYTEAGFFPNRNFIISSEDSLNPFTGAQAAELVSRYFGVTIR